MMRPDPYPEVQQADPAATSASARKAIQVALDRRDNGGDARDADEQ